MEKSQKPVLETLITGVISGFVATQALDLIGTFIYENEDRKTYDEENLARGGRHAYEQGLVQLATLAGKTLTEDQIRQYGWVLHRTFGIVGGVQYALLRNKFPKIGAGLGLLYGLGFFTIVDEILVPATKQTPGPQKFNWKVHARGLAAHVAYGVASELTTRAIEAAKKASDQVTEYAKNSSVLEGHAGDDPQRTPSTNLLKFRKKINI